jgi:hypothetical protein
MKKTVIMMLMAIAPAWAMAQENIEADIQADVVSKNLWRGQDLGGVSIKPRAEVRWKGIYLNAAGATGFDAATKEYIDVNVGYRAPFGLNFGVGTHWQSCFDTLNRFLHFKSKETGHHFEANLGYTNKYFSLQAYTTFGGNDFKGVNGDRAYSTFIELSVPFRAGGLDWDLRAGVTPMESAGVQYTIIPEGAAEGFGIIKKEYLYGGKFTCNMASIRATKTLEYKNVKIPVFAEFHANPELKTARFLAGVSVVVF